MDPRAVLRVDGKFFEGRELAAVEHGVVEVRHRGRPAARGGDAQDLGRRDGGLLRVDHRLAVARELHVVVLGVATGHDARNAAVHGHELDVLTAAVAHREEEVRGIGRPGEAFYPAVKRLT